MTFEKYFRLSSYAAVFCGFLALWVSGSFGLIETVIFIAVMLLAWKLEDTRRQMSERLGTAMIVLALPLYYLLWRYGFFDFSSSETALPGILARLILSLTAIKLLQKKSDRDWIFLYVMSFFELLLAAGLSISIGYLASFTVYIFVMACTIILFEIRKTDRQTFERSTAINRDFIRRRLSSMPIRKVVAASTTLIFLIALIGVPTFFLLPRVGGAGLGGNPDVVKTQSGFSDRVTLGGFGRIQQDDKVVMRVRIENDAPQMIRWRGIALDTFDGKSWSRTKSAVREPRTRNDRDLIQVDAARRPDGMTVQTVYLEPLDQPVIFGLTRMIGVQGNFPLLYRDTHGSVTFQPTGDRVSYKVLSDTAFPAEDRLRADRMPYNADHANYLQLPRQVDPRISQLTRMITSGAANRYDSARAVERHLQNEFGYTLDLKASGDEPLSDFLFNVREGHCEYFATAMAVMLRTQGIATRIVNGFQTGDYNETADVYVVRQRHAHSWVEVYFPATDSWVTFDPTPYAGQVSESGAAGFTDRFRKYLEALETFWIQYFVAFDNQEQRSLFVSVRRGLADYQSGIASGWNELQAEIAEWWKQVRGDAGLAASAWAIGRAALIVAAVVVGILLLVWLYRKIVKSKIWRLFVRRVFATRRASVVEFYERMQMILAEKGLVRPPHQTPLEFAFAVGVPEVIKVTEIYNAVRFGDAHLTEEQVDEVEASLGIVEGVER